MLEQEHGDSVHYRVCTTNLPARVYGRRTPGAWSSKAAVQGQSTTHAGYPGEIYASGSTASLSCFAMRALTTCLGGDFDGLPGCWVTTGPRFALLQDELRDAGQRELAAILKLLPAQPLQLFEELPRVGALEADVI